MARNVLTIIVTSAGVDGLGIRWKDYIITLVHV